MPAGLQYSLWDGPPVEADPDGLRPYQREAVEAIERELVGHRSTLLVMATGLGKTVISAALARTWRSEENRRDGTVPRVLFIVHRKELVQQAKGKLASMCGESVEVEQAETFAGLTSRIVVASVPTLKKMERLARWPSDHFDLVIVDECHHSVSNSYARILSHFPDAKVMGMTATPKRADELAMGKVFESEAYVMDIHAGVDDGYLVPVKVRQIHVSSIDLRKVKTTMGDFAIGELDAIMATEENLHGVVKPTMEQAGDRQTLIFTTSVANAHRMAEIANRYRPNCARAIDGTTNTWERKSTLAQHEKCEFQYLFNVGCFTEGYDSPRLGCIAIARLTQSVSLYAQMMGRGLRPIEPPDPTVTAEERRARIAASAKPTCMILDFCGQHGRNAPVTAVDILGGRYGEATRARAKKLAEKHPLMVEEALDLAKKQLEEERLAAIEQKRRAIQAEVKYSYNEVSPFRVLGITLPNVRNSRWGAGPADDRDIERLKRFHVSIPSCCNRMQARRLLDECYRRIKKHLCTFKQMQALSAMGHDCREMSMDRAHVLCEAYAQNHWQPLPTALVRELTAERRPGEEG